MRRVLHRRLLATIVAVSIAVVATAGFAPANKAEPRTIFTAVGTALEGHGITPCETTDWAARYDELDRPFYVREERARRIRLVNVAQPCPPPDEFGLIPEDQTEGVVRIIIYKTVKLRDRGVERERDAGRFVYAYDKKTLVVLQLTSRPELEDPFVAAMNDLGARPVSETPTG